MIRKKWLWAALTLLFFSAFAESEARTVHLRAVGDLMVHQKQLDLARQPDGSYDFHDQYALIAPSLAAADYTIANLETTLGLSGGKPYSGYPRFNSPETLLDTLRDAGVDFLTLANNHMLDRFEDGLKKTVKWVDRYGFDHAGAHRNKSEKNAPVTAKVNGVTLGFLSYTESTNGKEEKCSEKVVKYGINYLKNADFAADVKRLRAAGAEIVIALPHWGHEYEFTPGDDQISTAKAMIAAGVDVILGSHPHVVQPVEIVRAGGRTGLVAYSLGNFISNMSQPGTDCGIILDLVLREKDADGFQIDTVAAVPVFCWNREDRLQVIPAGRYDLQPPEGMSGQDFEHMRKSTRALRKLLDERVLFMLE